MLSDTHLRDEGGRRLPEAVYAGVAHRRRRSCTVATSSSAACCDELATYAPVHAVLGNNDTTLRGTLPERLVIELNGVRVGMVHDSGLTKGRAARMRRAFPTVTSSCSVTAMRRSTSSASTVSGCSTPDQRRNVVVQPHPSFATFTVDDGRITDHRIVALV